jgi:hypothetical protein
MPDIIYFGQNLFSIEQARMLNSSLSSFPLEKEKRFIVIEVEKISTEASNALLKILEEDADFISNSIFIFLVRDSSILLETILSRSILVTMESNSEFEFIKLVGNQGFKKRDLVAFMCSFKESELKRALYIKEKFNLDIEVLAENLEKAFKMKELSLEFFKFFEDLKMFPFSFAFRAIEYLFLRSSRANISKISYYYSTFFKGNKHSAKQCKDNQALFLLMWFFLNKYSIFEELRKKAEI